eukprot:jgi/Astpho2/8525/fgenesh1_pg.00125_%23_30_t
MSEPLSSLRVIARTLFAKAQHLLADVPSSTLQLTGVLGLAAVLYGLYALRSGFKRDPPGSRSTQAPRQGGQAGQSLPAGSSTMAQIARAPLQSYGAASQQQPAAAGSSAREIVQAQLAGARLITVSVPGVLFEESTPSQLQEGATLRSQAAAVVKEMAQVAQVYLIAHVVDDVGEATVRGALESAGLLGGGPGQIRPHRALFCSTLEGKNSMVRQLDAQLHIDGHPSTIEDLKRFIPRLLHICQAGTAAAGQAYGNVTSAQLLTDAFGVHS